MKMYKLLTLLVFLSTITVSFSQTGCVYNVERDRWEDPAGNPCINTVVSAVPFLRIIPDARSGAMGDVGIAISPDPNAMHFNASKLAFVEKDLSISATYTPWLRSLGLNDVYMAYLSGYKQLDELQTVGLSLRYFSMGDIQFTNENGEPIGNGRPNEFEITGAYARKLGENFSAALSAKFIYSNLASGQTVGGVIINPGTAGAADISMTYRIPLDDANDPSSVTIGLALSNIGTKITYTESINRDFIPANFGLGAAWKINLDDFNTLTIAADVNKLMVPTPCLDTVEGGCDQNNNDIFDYREQSMFSGLINSWEMLLMALKKNFVN